MAATVNLGTATLESYPTASKAFEPMSSSPLHKLMVPFENRGRRAQYSLVENLVPGYLHSVTRASRLGSSRPTR